MREAGVVRRRRSRSEVEALVAEFEASGLMRAAFCQQWGLAVGTLDKYRRRMQNRPQSGAGPLLPREVISTSSRSADSNDGRDGVLVVELEAGVAMRLAKAAKIVENGIGETLSYYSMPPEHWRCLRTNNPLERLMPEIRRRTRVAGAIPNGQPAMMLVTALLRHVAATKRGTMRYLQMERLAEVATIA